MHLRSFLRKHHISNTKLHCRGNVRQLCCIDRRCESESEVLDFAKKETGFRDGPLGVPGPSNSRRFTPGRRLHFRPWEQNGRGDTLRSDDTTFATTPLKGPEAEFSGSRPLRARPAGVLPGPEGLLRSGPGEGAAGEGGGIWQLHRPFLDPRPLQLRRRHDPQGRGQSDRRLRLAAQAFLDRLPGPCKHGAVLHLLVPQGGVRGRACPQGHAAGAEEATVQERNSGQPQDNSARHTGHVYPRLVQKRFRPGVGLKVLTKGLTGSVSVQNAYYALPALNRKSLLYVTSGHCRKEPIAEEALQRVLDVSGEAMSVQYSVWMGEEVNLGRTWRLKMRANSTIYDAIETVAKIDNGQRVEYNVVEGKPFVTALNGKKDDPEMGTYWFVYLKHPDSDKDPKIIEESPVDIKLRPNQEVILWYKRGPWSGQMQKFVTST